MNNRFELNDKFELLCDHVYFQPPETIKLTYPCIVYNLTQGDSKYANDMTYTFRKCYDVTIISKNPDEPLVNILPYKFMMCSMSTQFISEGLHHTVFRIYY